MLFYNTDPTFVVKQGLLCRNVLVLNLLKLKSNNGLQRYSMKTKGTEVKEIKIVVQFD